jgi:hypothetical protein
MATTNQKVAAAVIMAVHTRIRATGLSLVWSGISLMSEGERMRYSREVSAGNMGSTPYFIVRAMREKCAYPAVGGRRTISSL